jgi:hypothetical protein
MVSAADWQCEIIDGTVDHAEIARTLRELAELQHVRAIRAPGDTT